MNTDTPRHTVELISTGAELLNGRSVNRHAQTLGDRLGSLGIRLVRDTTVPDDLDRLSDALRGALDRVDLVFVTGGLGPTGDDLTRDAVADVLGRRVVMSDDALRHVRERYQKFGRAMGPAGERQARIVEGAEPLLNRVGAAPGERIESGNKLLFLLPGPPAELEAVLEDHVLPWLRNKLHGGPEIVPAQIYMVCGPGESEIVNRFEQAGFPPPGIDVAYCASAGRVEIRLSEGKPRRQAEEGGPRGRAARGAPGPPEKTSGGSSARWPAPTLRGPAGRGQAGRGAPRPPRARAGRARAGRARSARPT